jgi:hypothetical protein
MSAMLIHVRIRESCNVDENLHILIIRHMSIRKQIIVGVGIQRFGISYPTPRQPRSLLIWVEYENIPILDRSR